MFVQINMYFIDESKTKTIGGGGRKKSSNWKCNGILIEVFHLFRCFVFNASILVTCLVSCLCIYFYGTMLWFIDFDKCATRLINRTTDMWGGNGAGLRRWNNMKFIMHFEIKLISNQINIQIQIQCGNP